MLEAEGSMFAGGGGGGDPGSSFQSPTEEERRNAEAPFLGGAEARLGAAGDMKINPMFKPRGHSEAELEESKNVGAGMGF